MPSSPLPSWAPAAGVNEDASRTRLKRSGSNGDVRRSFRIMGRSHCPIRIRGSAGKRCPCVNAAWRLTAAARLLIEGDPIGEGWTLLTMPKAKSRDSGFRTGDSRGRRAASLVDSGQWIQEEDHGGHEIERQQEN